MENRLVFDFCFFMAYNVYMIQFERMPKPNIESSESPKSKEKEKSVKEIKKTKKEPEQKGKGITRREFLKWGAKVAGGILAEKMLPTETIARITKNIETESHKELIKKINSINELIKKIEEKEDLPEEVKEAKLEKLVDLVKKIIYDYPGFYSLLSEQPKESHIKNYQDLISSHSYSNWHPLIRGFLSRDIVVIVKEDKTGKSLKLLKHFIEKNELDEFSKYDQYSILSNLLDILKQRIQKEKIQATQEVLDYWLLSERINDLEENSAKRVIKEILWMSRREYFYKEEGYGFKFIDYFFKDPKRLNKLSSVLLNELLNWARLMDSGSPSVEKFWKDFFIKKRSKEEKYSPLILKQLGAWLEDLPLNGGDSFIKGIEEAGYDIYYASPPSSLYERISQRGLSSLHKKILEDVNFYKEDDSLESVYGGVARMTNGIHDRYERENWREKVSNFLKHLSDEELGYLFSYGGFELYTGTYNEVYKNLSERMKAEGKNFLEWIKGKYPENTENVRQHFLLSLASRKKLGEVVKEQSIDLRNLIKQTCQSIEKNAHKDLSLSYLMVALEEVHNLSGKEEKRYLLEQIKEIKETHFNISVFKLLTYHKLYPEYFSKEKMTSKEKKIFNLIEWIEKPDYQELIKEKNTLRSLVVFAQSAEGYLEELKELFKKEKYKDRGYSIKEITIEGNPGYLIKGKVKDQKGREVNLEFYLARDIKQEKFKELMESGKYSLIFTRHHSYEGKRYLGVGSDKVLPQVCGTVGTGKGPENNAMVIVATEEIAKGFLENLDWDKIWQNMGKRMSLENFRSPHNLSFLFGYASQIDIEKAEKRKIGIKKPKGIVIFDGGCGGVNRIPQYLNKYKKSINNFVSLY